MLEKMRPKLWSIACNQSRRLGDGRDQGKSIGIVYVIMMIKDLNLNSTVFNVTLFEFVLNIFRNDYNMRVNRKCILQRTKAKASDMKHCLGIEYK